MKRSRINNIIAEADDMIQSFGFILPKFAYWSVDEFIKNKTISEKIINAQLGWDVTDYGEGDFDKLGLFLFTLRNGNIRHLRKGMGMCYAEKLMISRKYQISPMHRHYMKSEDIINRGGGQLIIELYGSDERGEFGENKGGIVYCDGIQKAYNPGEKIILSPGDSITLTPNEWHSFWSDDGDILISEISTVNDDNVDNLFRDPIGRFSTIEEDEAPRHLLVSDYDAWLNDK